MSNVDKDYLRNNVSVYVLVGQLDMPLPSRWREKPRTRPERRCTDLFSCGRFGMTLLPLGWDASGDRQWSHRQWSHRQWKWRCLSKSSWGRRRGGADERSGSRRTCVRRRYERSAQSLISILLCRLEHAPWTQGEKVHLPRGCASMAAATQMQNGRTVSGGRALTGPKNRGRRFHDVTLD